MANLTSSVEPADNGNDIKMTADNEMRKNVQVNFDNIANALNI